MRKLIMIGISAAFVVTAIAVYAQEHAGHGDVEAAVDAVAAKYMEAWAAGDAGAVAALYTEDGDSMDIFGVTFTGRDAIEGSVADVLEQYSGSTIDIQRTSVHMVRDGIVVTDGTWEVKGASVAEGVPTNGFYTIILTQSGDEWLIRSGRAKVAPPMPSE